MVFSSTIFIFAFLPITLVLYYLAYKSQYLQVANLILLLASIFFYAWGGVKYALILLAVIFINYALTILMDKYERYKKILFIIILLIDIGNLLYFKYFNFFVDNIKSIATAMGKDVLTEVVSVVLPIGISFYTFQILSYVVDVYLKKVDVQKSFIKLALYVMMFPQLIAGPIVRYKDVNDEISERSISCQDVEDGIKRFIIGFFKKVFLANAMGSMADVIFTLDGNVNTIYAWLGAICYTLQIYYDFSAYSDMAIGIGSMLGFHFNENFNLPYISQSIQEFWRRWHISLSSWFRDYVYIPLGGNRKGKIRTYINLAVVFLLTGFWHGAAWQFIIWGIYHGFFIIIERLGFKKVLDKIPAFFRHLYTVVVVIIGWVFFRADNLTLAGKYLKNMFSMNFTDFKNYQVVTQFSSIFIICFVLSIVFSFTRLEILNKSKIWTSAPCAYVRYLTLWILSVLYLVGLSYNPFIYFKF